MATISDHGSSRWKDTSGSQSICFKESCRWNGKRRTQKMQILEIRQSFHRSGHHTSKSKSLEDHNVAVKVSPHRYLNSTKFVIQCRELNSMEEDEIAKELRPQGITAVKRISVRHDLFCLTINGQTFPEKICVGYLKVKTKPYIPNPQRCFQCHQFGHMKTSCKGKAVCARCGEQGHSFEDCTNETKCINYEGNHYAISRDCPKWELEKEIIKLKYKDGISFVDARKRLQPSWDPSKNSYASVTKTPEKSTKPQQPWARNIRPPTDFDTEVQFLKYILNYCLTRLDTINNQVTAHDTLNETIPEHPVPQDEPATSTDTNLVQHESAASNDQTNDDMEYIAASSKRGHDDSSDNDVNEKPIKKSASSSTTSVQTDTQVSKERGREDLTKISSFPSAPRSGEQRANRTSLSPIRPPSFTSGGSSRGNSNHEKPPPPPKPKEGHVKTPTLRKS